MQKASHFFPRNGYPGIVGAIDGRFTNSAAPVKIDEISIEMSLTILLLPF